MVKSFRYAKYAALIVVSVLFAGFICGCGPRPAKYAGQTLENAAIPSQQEIDAAATEARRIIYLAARCKIPPLRGAAIESLASVNDPQAGKILLNALGDQEASVRFAAAMGLGKCRYEPARGHLLAILDSETDRSVKAGIIYALFCLGDGRHLKLLGELLCDDSPEVRANAALVIGMTGLAQGVKPLTGRLEVESHSGVKQRIAESLAILGLGEGFSMLFNYARVGEPHQQVESITAMGLTGDFVRCAPILIWALNDSFAPPQRIAAAQALGMLGDPRGYQTAIMALGDTENFCSQCCGRAVSLDNRESAQLKAFAAVALGDIAKVQAITPLMDYIAEANDIGKLSAARAILQIIGENGIETEASGSAGPANSAEIDQNTVSEMPQMFTAPLRK